MTVIGHLKIWKIFNISRHSVWTMITEIPCVLFQKMRHENHSVKLHLKITYARRIQLGLLKCKFIHLLQYRFYLAVMFTSLQGGHISTQDFKAWCNATFLAPDPAMKRRIHDDSFICNLVNCVPGSTLDSLCTPCLLSSQHVSYLCCSCNYKIYVIYFAIPIPIISH